MEDHVFFDAETTGVETTCSIICAVTIRNGVVKRFREEIPGRLSPETSQKLAQELLDAPFVVTFNGAAFDFKVLAHHLDNKEMAKDIAQKAAFGHKDIMFDFLYVVCYQIFFCVDKCY